MAPASVYLHIGSPKTGTTYIQDVLWANREVLEADGVLLPGSYRYARVQATRDLLKWEPVDGDLPQTWRKLAGEVNRWPGRSAIISQEFLCWASTDQIDAMVHSFPKSRVEIVLTTRDLARLVPAQWQTAMRQRNTWTLDEYADAVAGAAEGKPAKMAARHFWRRQDYGPILQRWSDAVGVSQVRVVTLPAPGGDPDELWKPLLSSLRPRSGVNCSGRRESRVARRRLRRADATPQRAPHHRRNAHAHLPEVSQRCPLPTGSRAAAIARAGARASGGAQPLGSSAKQHESWPISRPWVSRSLVTSTTCVPDRRRTLPSLPKSCRLRSCLTQHSMGSLGWQPNTQS